MNITEIVSHVNLLADEDYPLNEVRPFINDAIARVNIDCYSSFPLLNLDDVEFTALPDKWILALFIPFIVGRLKQKDSSQFEYGDAYAEFMANLTLFKTNYTIPEEYKDPDVPENPLQVDFDASPWGWF